MGISWQKKELQVEPYSKLAYIYDEVMSHVDYHQWANFVAQIIKKLNLSPNYVSDIACGTGSLLFNLAPFGYHLYGFDHSYDSIWVAKRKFKSHNLKIPLWVGDMKHFFHYSPVDVIVCLYDSINYLLTLDDYNKLFESVYASLNKNGLFIFDICTEQNSIKFFENYFERNGSKGYQYTRKSNYDRKIKIHSNLFKINFESSDVIYVEKHVQKILSINEILEMVPNNKFRTLHIFEEFSFKKASENSYRVHFVLMRV